MGSTSNNVIIPKPYECYKFLEQKYKLPELKEICKYYKLKKVGTKPVLTLQIFNHLKFFHHASIIQKYVKRYFIQKLLKYIGNTALIRKNCNNDTDFYTLDETKHIHPFQWFSYKNENGFIYGFHSQSFLNLINKYQKCKEPVLNPYDRSIIPDDTIQHFYSIQKLSNKLIHSYSKRYNIEFSLHNENTIHELSLQQKFIDLFQQIDSYGNYSQAEWLLNQPYYKWKLFIREFVDIWNYRLNLSKEVKRNILPPTGNVLNVQNILNITQFQYLKYSVYEFIYPFVYSGITDEFKKLGCIYILTAITLISEEAAIALPWLYDAVQYEEQGQFS